MNRSDIRPMHRKFVRAGSFLVSYFLGNVGQHHIVNVYEPHSIADSTSRCVLVRGRWKVVSMPEGEPLRPDYVAGDKNVDRPAIMVAGRYVLECVEDGTFYLCLMRPVGDRRMRAGYVSGIEPFTVAQFGVFALGSGGTIASIPGLAVPVVGPNVVYARSGPVTITPQNRCVGIRGELST